MRIDKLYYVTEIQWYFHHSEGDTGYSSNWNAMVMASIFPGGATITDRFTDGLLRAVDRRRQVEEAFFSLPQEEQRTLYYAYGITRLPGSRPDALILLEKAFGSDLGRATLATSLMDHKKLLNLIQRAAIGNWKTQDKENLSKLRIEAQTNLTNALLSYSKARKCKT